MVMFLQLVLTIAVNPKLLNLSRTLLKNSELEFVSSMFKARQFNDTVAGLTIFIDKKTDDGVFTEHQAYFRGGRKQPLTESDINKKYDANLNYSKISEEEKNNLNVFIDSIFEKPDFSKIIIK